MKVKSTDKVTFLQGQIFRVRGKLWRVKETFKERWDIFQKRYEKYIPYIFEEVREKNYTTKEVFNLGRKLKKNGDISFEKFREIIEYTGNKTIGTANQRQLNYIYKKFKKLEG